MIWSFAACTIPARFSPSKWRYQIFTSVKRIQEPVTSYEEQSVREKRKCRKASMLNVLLEPENFAIAMHHDLEPEQ